MSIKNIENDVQAVYNLVNPSQRTIDHSDNDFRSFEDGRRRMFRDHLNFPTKMFVDADLLDLGAGTGEKTVIYSRWGASCTLLDLNTQACERAKQVYKKFAPKAGEPEIIQKSIFELKLDRQFDIITCEGVLHHTADKASGFSVMANLLKPQGYLLLGISNKSGMLQRNLQRLILYRYSDSHDELEALALRLFKAHIDRAQKFGHRSVKSIIYDNYINPQIDSPDVAEVFEWFRNNGIKFYSSWPRIIPHNLADSPSDSLDELQNEYLMGPIPELFWMAHKTSDAEQIQHYLECAAKVKIAVGPILGQINNITPDLELDYTNLRDQVFHLQETIEGLSIFAHEIENASKLIAEVGSLIEIMKRGDLADIEAFLPTTEILFCGASGTAMNFIMGYKNQD